MRIYPFRLRNSFSLILLTIIILLIGMQLVPAGVAAPLIQQPEPTPTYKNPTPTPLPPTVPPTPVPPATATTAPTVTPTRKPPKKSAPQPTLIPVLLPESGGTPMWPTIASLLLVVLILVSWIIGKLADGRHRA